MGYVSAGAAEVASENAKKLAEVLAPYLNVEYDDDEDDNKNEDDKKGVEAGAGVGDAKMAD